MKYKGFFAYLLDRSIRVKLPGFPALILALITTSGVFAADLQPEQTAEPKKLIKEAAKLMRAGSLPEAEGVLRRAIAADDKRQ